MDYIVEKPCRDRHVTETHEGASEIYRIVIARSVVVKGVGQSPWPLVPSLRGALRHVSGRDRASADAKRGCGPLSAVPSAWAGPADPRCRLRYLLDRSRPRGTRVLCRGAGSLRRDDPRIPPEPPRSGPPGERRRRGHAKPPGRRSLRRAPATDLDEADPLRRPSAGRVPSHRVVGRSEDRSEIRSPAEPTTGCGGAASVTPCDPPSARR